MKVGLDDLTDAQTQTNYQTIFAYVRLAFIAGVYMRAAFISRAVRK
jgi:hypothetical protein